MSNTTCFWCGYNANTTTNTCPKHTDRVQPQDGVWYVTSPLVMRDRYRAESAYLWGPWARQP